jgi:hypothetical protein
MEKTKDKTNLNIHQRIHAMMTGLSFVTKENKRVNNQYTFVSHDAVTRAVRDQAVIHRVVIIPSLLEYKQEGNRTECRVEIKMVNIDYPDDFISGIFLGFGVDNQDKGPGKAFSYACKYGYLKMLALETGDDPERDMIDHKPGPEVIKKTMISKVQMEVIAELLIGAKKTIIPVLNHFGVDELGRLTQGQGKQVIKQLELEVASGDK